jgi:hypothetical protein
LKLMLAAAMTTVMELENWASGLEPPEDADAE